MTVSPENPTPLVDEIFAEWASLRVLSPAALIVVIEVCRDQWPRTMNSRLREHRALVVLRELVRQAGIDRLEVDGRLYRFEEDEWGDFLMTIEPKEGV